MLDEYADADGPPSFPTGPSDEEVSERLERVRERLRSDVDEVSDVSAPTLPSVPAVPAAPDFEARLRELEARADAAKARRSAKATSEQKRLKSDSESNRSLGIGLTVAYTIVGVPLMAIGIGWLVDMNSHTNIYRGLGALIGSVIGIVGAIVLLNRHQSQEK